MLETDLMQKDSFLGCMCTLRLLLSARDYLFKTEKKCVERFDVKCCRSLVACVLFLWNRLLL